MKATPLLALSALLCTLAACAPLQPPTDFNLTQASGKWYLIGLATNASWLATHKGSIKDVTTTVKPTAAGDVNTTYSMLGRNGTCQRFTHAIQKTETPGRFTSTHKHQRTYCVSVVEVVYDSYLLLHTVQTKPEDASSYTLSEFYTRTCEVSAALEAKFVKFAKSVGVPSCNVYFLPRNGTFCY